MSTPLRERPDAPLGTLIFRAGLLPAETIETALQESSRTGKRLGEILLERNLLAESELSRLLAGQKGLPFVTLRERGVDVDAAKLFSEDQARLYRALPFDRDGDVPVVAISDPTNEIVMRNIREALGGGDVQFAVATRSELADLTTEIYRPNRNAHQPNSNGYESNGNGALTHVEAAAAAAAAIAAPEPEAAVVAPPERDPVAAASPVSAPEPAVIAQPARDSVTAGAPESPPEHEPELPAAPVQLSPTPEPEITPPAPAAPAPPAPERAPVENSPEPQAVRVEPRPAPVRHAEPMPEPEPAPTPQPVAEAAPPAAKSAPPPESVPPPAPRLAPQPERAQAQPVAAEPAVKHAVAADDEFRPTDEPEATGPATLRVVIRLSNNDRIEAAVVGDVRAAKAQAKALIRYIAGKDRSDWPYIGGRFVRPDAIVSVDLVEQPPSEPGSPA